MAAVGLALAVAPDFLTSYLSYCERPILLGMGTGLGNPVGSWVWVCSGSDVGQPESTRKPEQTRELYDIYIIAKTIFSTLRTDSEPITGCGCGTLLVYHLLFFVVVPTRCSLLLSDVN